jgi:PKD repeat protein
MSERGAVHVSLVMVIALLVTGAVAGCLKDDDGNGDGNGDDEVLANAGPDVYGKVGVAVTFNASASSGKIETYWWDVDRGTASTNLTQDAVGEVVEHTYTQAGVYTVTLTVEGKGDLNSTDTLTAYVDLVENRTSSLAITTLNQTYEYSVKPEVEKILLTLKYPSIINVIVPVNLDMEVWTGDQTLVTTTVGQTRDQDDTQTEELDVAPAQIIENGGFRVIVRWAGVPEGEVDFTLDVALYYHPI